MLNRSCVIALFLIFASAAGLRAQMQMPMGGAAGSSGAQANPVSADAKGSYDSIKNILMRSAAKMPEDKYSFRTTPQVRTYAEMILHIADVQTTLCAIAQGQQKKADTAGKTSKADVTAALKASFDYCDPVYASMTDQEGAQTVRMFGRMETKLGVLFFNVTHDNEMYGQMVAYLRINGLVPPSSEGRM